MTIPHRILPAFSCLTLWMFVPDLPGQAPPADALPTGAVVASGAASFAQDPAQLTIGQGSDKLVINWDSFSIGSDASVDFQQPSTTAVALNRVLGSDPSAIFGQLTANGRVILLNPQGVLFGPGAQVDVGSLVASTMAVSDADFLSGQLQLLGSGNGSVVNQGTITADQAIALLAPEVRNEGALFAQLGAVTLASGNAFTLSVLSSGGLSVALDEAELESLAESGHLVADLSGQVVLSAAAADQIADGAVTSDLEAAQAIVQSPDGTFRLVANSGTITAGTIVIDAGPVGAADLDGNLDATNPSGVGGDIAVTGFRNDVAPTATIDASGSTGGGTIRIGGGYKGQDTSIRNAWQTVVPDGVSISANATDNGDGGTVIIWADGYTGYATDLSATGGPNGGNGGFAEVSGLQLLNFQGTANLTAPVGTTGTLLLDPYDLTISSAARSNVSTTAPFISTGSGSNLNTSDLASALTTASVTVSTSNAGDTLGGTEQGDIIIDDSVQWFGANTLTLQADDDILINANIRAVDGGLVMAADVNGDAATVGTGQILISNNAQVIIDNAAASLTATAYGNISDGTGVSEGAFRVNGASSFTSTNGNVLLDSATNNFNGSISVTTGTAGALDLFGQGTLTLKTISLGSAGGIFETNGSITQDATPAFASTGGVSFTVPGSNSINIPKIDGNLTIKGATAGGIITLGNATDTGVLTFNSATGSVIAGVSPAVSVASGTVTVVADTIVLNDPITTEGGGVNLTADTTSVTAGSGANITTTGPLNEGVSSGKITVVGQTDVTLQNLTTTGNNNTQDVGANAAAVQVTATTGDLTVGAVTTSGGNASANLSASLIETAATQETFFLMLSWGRSP